MANQQLLFLPRPLPDSAFNRLFEPIRVKCALDTGRVLIDETSLANVALASRPKSVSFEPLARGGGLETTATLDLKFLSGRIRRSRRRG